MKKVLLGSLFVILVFVVGGVVFLRSMGMFSTELVYSTSEGAIGGYDPVAYFDENKPVKGSKEFSTEWNAATWFFSTAERKARFEAAPERYAPQFGGYCAMAVSGGYTAMSSPDAFAIVDNKLYLNFDESVQAEWSEKQDELIAAGEENWPGALLGK